MTMLKDDLIAQHYCRQLQDIIGAAKINKLMSTHISEWCFQLELGVRANVKDKKGTSMDLVNVPLTIDDLELFIRELQDGLTLFASKKEDVISKNGVSDSKELKTRSELALSFGVSDSTIDRFFRWLNNNNIEFYKQPLHGRSDVYRLGEMTSLYQRFTEQRKMKIA